MNLPAGGPPGPESAASPAGIGVVENTLLVPVAADLAADERTCSHFLGLWGATVVPNAAIGSRSPASCPEPSALIDQLKRRVSEFEEAVATRYEPALARLSAGEPELRRQREEIARLTAERDALLSENAALQEQIGDVLEPEVAALAGQVRTLGHEVKRLTRSGADLAAGKAARETQIRDLTSEAETLREALSQAESAREALAVRLRAAEAARLEYEPELARLRAHVEHATFEKEVQRLRGRVMAHAERSRRAAETVAAMQRKLRDTEDQQRSWFVPEIERLNRIIADYETTKREWWEPQLELRAARIAALETDCREWYEPRLAQRDARIAELERKLGSS
jgi:DNA repair exonuclease SbcCD ATPase subunit